MPSKQVEDVYNAGGFDGGPLGRPGSRKTEGVERDLSPEYLASLKSRLKGLAPILPRDCISSEAVRAIEELEALIERKRASLRRIKTTIIVSECQKIAREALGE